MQRSTLKKTRPLISVASALALVLAGCGGSGDDASDAKPAAATESQNPSTTSEAPDECADTSEESEATSEDDESGEDDVAEDESDEDAGADSLPSKVVEAGTVKPGATRTASGKEDSLVTFEQSDSFAVVAEFDCKECKGDIEIQQLGSHSPLDSGEKSLSGSYLLDLIASPDEEQTLIVRADGKWNVKLRSWNDLPISSGTQEGKGSEVIYIGDAASGVEVTYKPPKDGGELDVTITSAVDKDGDDPKVKTISGSKKFTKEEKIKLPGVLTISGKGSWTVKLVS